MATVGGFYDCTKAEKKTFDIEVTAAEVKILEFALINLVENEGMIQSVLCSGCADKVTEMINNFKTVTSEFEKEEE